MLLKSMEVSLCLQTNFHVTSVALYNNNNVFLPADTKSLVQKHTIYTMQVDKNIQNEAFYNGIG